MALSRVTSEWIRVLLHGRSADRPDVKEAVDVTRQRGHYVEVRVSWELGDMRRLAHEAVEDGVEILVAGGGDGTINEVVRGLFEATEFVNERPSLGILPLRTVNAFARSCRIPSDPRCAFELVCSTQPSPIDVIRSGNRVLVNIAAWGIGPAMDGATGSQATEGSRDWHSLNCLCRRTSPKPEQVRLSGPGFEWAGECVLLAIGNGRELGEGCALCPDALLDDGLIDLTVLPGIPGQEIAALCQAIRSRGIQGVEDLLIRARVPWLEIDFEKEQQIEFDGEPEIQDRFLFEVEERSLRVHLPEGMLLHRQPNRRTAEIKSFRESSRKPSGSL